MRFLVILFVSAVLLHAVGLNANWRFQRDSAVYLSLARALVEGRGYVHNGRFHTRYSPGLPVTLAAVGSATGMPEMPSDSFLPLNAVGVAAGVGCVAFMALIMRELGLSWVQATVPVVLLTFSRTRYYYSLQIMTDVPFACLALGALWCGLRMRAARGAASWAWCGGAALLAATASMFRPVGPLLVPALAAGLWLHRDALRRWLPAAGKTLLILLVVLAPVIAWSAHSQAQAPEAEVGYTRNKLDPQQLVKRSAVLFARWSEHPEGFADAAFGSNLGIVPGLILMGVMAVGLVVSLRRGERMLSVFALLCIAAILCGGWAIRRRYLVPALPVMLYWLVLGGTAVGAWLRRRTRFWTPQRLGRLGWGCVVCLLAVNVVRIGKLVWQNHSPDFYRRVEDGVVESYLPAIEHLRAWAAPDEAVLAREDSMVGYFTRLQTVGFSQDPAHRTPAGLIEDMRSAGVRYVLSDRRHEESTRAIKRLVGGHPGAFRPVRKWRGLELLLVYPARLRQIARTRASQEAPSSVAALRLVRSSSAGSRLSAMARASAAASPGGTSRPLTPSWITSGRAPTRVATTGRPKSSANRVTALADADR